MFDFYDAFEVTAGLPKKSEKWFFQYPSPLYITMIRNNSISLNILDHKKSGTKICI